MSPSMNKRELTVSNLNACWDSCLELFGGLSDEQFAVRSLCPDWDVKGVVAHLTSVEQALSGWVPTADNQQPPFEEIGGYYAAAVALAPAALVDKMREVLGARREQLASATDELFEVECMSPVGMANYGRFMAIREFDFWMHERDCRTPLGMPTDNGGPAAEMALNEVHLSIGFIVGKRIGMSEGTSIHFEIRGACERDIYVEVTDRAREVATLDDPTVTLRCDSMAFMDQACGRVDPAEPIDAGLISWSGDDELGRHAATHLRFTM